MLKDIICKSCNSELGNMDIITGLIETKRNLKVKTKRRPNSAIDNMILEDYIIYCECGKEHKLIRRIG